MGQDFVPFQRLGDHDATASLGLLEVVTRHPGKLVTGKALLQEVWSPAHGTETNYLRVHMAQLRPKLAAEPSRPPHPITEPGLGYRFEP